MKLSISKKFCKRSIKCLAMFAPLAYLFGSLFFGLNGAHGTQLWAEPVYTDEYLPVDTMSESGEYTLTFSSAENYLSSSDFESRNYYFDFTYNGTSRNRVSFYTYQSYNYMVFYHTSGGYSDIARYNLDTGVYTNLYSAPFVLYCDYSASSFVSFLEEFSIDFELAKKLSVPTETIPENNSAFTDFTFGQFFAKDNFLEKWGENAISDNPKGFAPFGTFLKYIDDNMLHLSDSQIGLMAYGYLYYTLHVLIAFFAFDILGFIPLFLQRVTDKIGGTEDD